MAKVRVNDIDRDIEKMFMQDIREKKRAGSGSFHKTGKGAKHGIKGGMMFAYQNMNRKEKREYTKPGKVEVYNMKDIISKEAFFKKSEADQKALLQAWRDNYKNDEILEQSGIPKTDYYSLVSKFGLKHARGGNMGINKRRYSPEEIAGFKENVIDFEKFLTLDGEQKAEVFEHYDAMFSTKELMELWDVKDSIVYSHRGNVKNFRNKQAKAKRKENDLAEQINKLANERTLKTPQIDERDVQGTLPLDEPQKPENEPKEQIREAIKEIEEPQEQIPAKKERIIPKFKFVRKEKTPQPEPKPEATGADYRISGIYTSKELSEKLDKLNIMISDENSNFEINLTIKEIRKSDEEKAKDESKEQLEKIMLSLAELVPNVFTK